MMESKKFPLTIVPKLERKVKDFLEKHEILSENMLFAGFTETVLDIWNCVVYTDVGTIYKNNKMFGRE